MIAVITVIHIIVCIFLVLVVLLQSGKGVDLSSFGGGATQTLFGARGAASFLERLTVVAAVTFMVTSLTLALMGSGSTKSVMENTAPVTNVTIPEASDGTPASEVPAPVTSSEATAETPSE